MSQLASCTVSANPAPWLKERRPQTGGWSFSPAPFVPWHVALLGVKQFSAYDAGGLRLHRQPRHGVRPFGILGVHSQEFAVRKPTDVRSDRDGWFASQRRTDAVAAAHEAVEDSILQRDDSAFSRGPSRVGRGDTDKCCRLLVGAVFQVARSAVQCVSDMGFGQWVRGSLFHQGFAETDNFSEWPARQCAGRRGRRLRPDG